MAHNRKLVLGGVALTMARIPHKLDAAAANHVRDELEQEMIQSGYLDRAPFKWVGLIIRYGLVDEIEPHYQKISAKHGDLPLAIEIDTHRLLDATEDEMAAVYRKATLIALAHAGKKYGLNTARIDQLLSEIV
jgi:predicted Zn-dependent protease with MMP-like domain